VNSRHLTTRRPSKDRDVTWSRTYCNGIVMWTLWRRDHRRAIHMRVVVDPKRLRRAWHELRNFVDEIDLRAMEETA